VEAAKREQEEKQKLEEKMRKMADDLARQEQERVKAAKDAEEKRSMQQKLMEAEASLIREKKRIEEMQQNRELLEMERQLDDERKKMEKLMHELSQEDIPPPPPDEPPMVAPKESLVKQRRLSTFIENIDLPAPPTAAPKLPPMPKAGQGVKFPMAALPPSLASLPPPPALSAPSSTVPPPAMSRLPAVPRATFPTQAPVSMPPPANLPPPPTAQPPKAKVIVKSKAELDAMVAKLGQKTDTSFNVFLQAGRERNLHGFIEGMQDSTGSVKEILSLASSVQMVESLQPKLASYMNGLSSSLKSLLLGAKTLANAIEQGQQTNSLLQSLEKIASEVLVTKYDILDFMQANGAAFFGFTNPMKEIYEAMAVRFFSSFFLFLFLYLFFAAHPFFSSFSTEKNGGSR